MNVSGKIPVICGPTGSGKTKAALEIAKKIPIEIISADSGQLIRELNIGTAKPTAAEQKLARFHLIDIIKPGDNYSAFQFIKDAEKAIVQILSRNKLPVIVGGTGLYLKALAEGVFDMESENPEVRAWLEREMEELGPTAMYNKLKNIDPAEASKTHLNNKVRVTRALEIYYLTGIPKSELIKKKRPKKGKFEYQYYCLMPARSRLYETINSRVDKMLKKGLLDELKGLVRAGKGELVQKMNVIGYNELLEHIKGNLELEKAVLLIKQNSRRYAKRQFTWFRHQTQGNYFPTPIELKRVFLREFAVFGKGK